MGFVLAQYAPVSPLFPAKGSGLKLINNMKAICSTFFLQIPSQLLYISLSEQLKYYLGVI